MFYIATKNQNGGHLEHSGTKGMKWGVRHYQNYDGTYTPEGLERYWPGSKHGRRGSGGIVSQLKSRSRRLRGSGIPTDVAKQRVRSAARTKKDVDDIINSMSAKDKQFILEGADSYLDFEQGAFVVKRVLKKVDGVPVSFVDLLDNGDSMHVCVATRQGDEYRDKGYASEAVREALSWFDSNKDSIPQKRIEWGAAEDNPASMKLAEKCGFVMESKHDGWVNYVYDPEAQVRSGTKSSKANLSSVNKLIDKMNKTWDYGVLYDGERILEGERYSNFDFANNYRTVPVKELAKTKIGNCWDFVNYQHAMYDKMGIPNKSYMLFVQRDNNPENAVTHTFSTIELDGKQYWTESAAWPMRGVHEISDPKDVVKALDKMYKGDATKHGWSLFEYDATGMDKGLAPDEFVEIVTRDENYVADSPGNHLAHHGIKGQKWGVRNGPPYPLSRQKAHHQRGRSEYSVNYKHANAADKDAIKKAMSTTEYHANKKAKYGEETKQSMQITARQIAEYIKKRSFRNQLDKKTGLYLKKGESSRIEDASKVNYGYEFMDPDRIQNCILCSVSYELRRKGYEVCAKGAEVGYNDEDLFRWYPDATWNYYNSAKTLKEDIVKDGDSRGNLVFNWKSGGGHCISYEVSNGALTLIDSQSGTIYENPDVILSRVDEHDMGYARLDNQTPDWSMLSEVVN